MERAGRFGGKKNGRRRVKLRSNHSDNSDEDYVVKEDEVLNDSDEYCSSLDEKELECTEEFGVEEEQMARAGRVGCKKNGIRRFKSEKKSDGSDEDYVVKEDEDVNDSDEYCSSFYNDDSEDFEAEELKVRSKKCRRGLGMKQTRVRQQPKKRRLSYKVDENDDDDSDYYESDEEFTPDEINDLDNDDDDDDYDNDENDKEDEFLEKIKSRKTGSSRLQKKYFAKGKQKKRSKRNCKVRKKTIQRKPKKNVQLMRKASSDNVMWPRDKEHMEVEMSEKNSRERGGRRRSITCSDFASGSDFQQCALSDYNFTVSEEEREQVREATIFCQNLPTTSRSSSLRRCQGDKEKVTVLQKRKRLRRKDKEQVQDVKSESVKRVCGICLSEEGNKTVQGTLNCCSHYFCFACIMEWSKVESRCPLCKQRFVTISKPARSNTGFDLRNAVVQVPERDQVYQPSEEELRSYLDPYENVICSECQQGGDDALMLLCDLCDSPAHTFCVGLGREVPEGSWYCEGCRATAFDSSNLQHLNRTPDQRSGNNLNRSSPIGNGNGMEGIDLNVAYVPETPLTPRNYSSPRIFNIRNPFTTSSGTGASTVLERRRMRNRINNVFRRELAVGLIGTSTASLVNNSFGSQIDRRRSSSTLQRMPH